jgi:hypothetical protein
MRDEMIQLAEQQIRGFTHAKDGGDIVGLAEDRGLTAIEWEHIKSGNLVMKKKHIQELDEHFSMIKASGGEVGD